MTAPLSTEQRDSTTEPWRPPTARERLQILNRSRTIAIVGASSNPARASHFVATYLLSSSTDFVVWFVNPRESSILGHHVYPALTQLPEAPDIVVAFRRVDELVGVAADAVEVGARTLWIQLGLWSDDAAELAHQAGLLVVMNQCIKIEHARFAGGLHLAGFDTGVISSKRPVRPASSARG